MADASPKVVGPGDGKAGALGAIGVRFMIWGEETDKDAWVRSSATTS